MSESGRVAVVIPCFNHGEFLPEAVESVLGSKRGDVELIVVDDGSTDEVTRREMDELRARGIRVLRQENRGLAAARNAGIQASGGEYILPLDADNRLRPEYIEHGTGVLRENPKVGVVYGDAQYVGERSGRWRVGVFDPNRLLHWNYIDACAMYRREVWAQTGGYDRTMPVQGFEDWDLWLGALENGWDFAYVSKILFDYRVGRDSMIARARGFEGEIEKFVTVKHALLYRREWQRLEAERRSVKTTARNLGRLLRSRLKEGFRRNGRNGYSDS